MIRVHFLINKLDIEHIIALGGKKSNEKLGKKGNRCKNAANSVTGHVCANSNTRQEIEQISKTGLFFWTKKLIIKGSPS